MSFFILFIRVITKLHVLSCEDRAILRTLQIIETEKQFSAKISSFIKRKKGDFVAFCYFSCGVGRKFLKEDDIFDKAPISFFMFPNRKPYGFGVENVWFAAGKHTAPDWKTDTAIRWNVLISKAFGGQWRRVRRCIKWICLFRMKKEAVSK